MFLSQDSYQIMNNSYDIKCKIIEEEIKSFWPEWQVARRLGGGAFGDVFQIYQDKDNFGIRVDSALKVIRIDNGIADNVSTAILSSGRQDNYGTEEESRTAIPELFRREIQIMEMLHGAPNIVIIEDFHFEKGDAVSTLYVRMELLTSLQEVLSERREQSKLFSIPEILKLGRDICTALIYCEKRGIIHRDIKPANLFVDRFGDYKAGDFGASKRMDSVHVARMMTGIGTISYMAPEIFRGGAYNNTVDIYALGLVLYQFLNNGRMPFLPATGSYTRQDIDSANYQRLHGVPVPSLAGKTVGRAYIDERLDAVVRKACAMNPADRYQTAEEFFHALSFREIPREIPGRKSMPGYGMRPQGSPAPAASLQGQQQDNKWAVSERKQPGDPSFNKPSQNYHKGDGTSRGSTAAIIIGLLLILAVAAVVVWQGSRRVFDLLPGSDTEADNPAPVEDDPAEDGLAEDDSVSNDPAPDTGAGSAADDSGSAEDNPAEGDPAPDTDAGSAADDPVSAEDNPAEGDPAPDTDAGSAADDSVPPVSAEDITYRDIVDSLVEKYGSLRISHNDTDWKEVNGLCFLKLIDFSGDGRDELMAVCKNEGEEHYSCYIYEEKAGKAELVFEKDYIEYLEYVDKYNNEIDVLYLSYTADTGYIFGTGWYDDAEIDITFYWYRNGRFSPFFRKKSEYDFDLEEEHWIENRALVDLYDEDRINEVSENEIVMPLRGFILSDENGEMPTFDIQDLQETIDETLERLETDL